MGFHSYRVVFCAPIPTGPRTPDFGSCSMSYSLLTARGRYSGLSGPVYRSIGMSCDAQGVYLLESKFCVHFMYLPLCDSQKFSMQTKGIYVIIQNY